MVPSSQCQTTRITDFNSIGPLVSKIEWQALIGDVFVDNMVDEFLNMLDTFWSTPLCRQ